jgi:hypothetical protein
MLHPLRADVAFSFQTVESTLRHIGCIENFAVRQVNTQVTYTFSVLDRAQTELWGSNLPIK